MADKNVQTRSEEGGLNYFETFEQALEAAKKDISIWKISYEGKRLVRQEDGSWKNEPIFEG